VTDHYAAGDYAAWCNAGCPGSLDEFVRARHVATTVLDAIKSTAPSVTRVTTGRCHRTLVRDPAWGNRALTGTEARWYREHVGEFAHVDVHPVLTLSGEIRYVADFLGWKRGPLPFVSSVLVEVKGSEAKAKETAVRRLVALCREHPLGPLVVTWREKGTGEWRTLGDLTPRDSSGTVGP